MYIYFSHLLGKFMGERGNRTDGPSLYKRIFHKDGEKVWKY